MKLVRRLLAVLPRVLRDPLIRSRVRIDDAEIRDLHVTIASTVADHVAAARLVHDGYVARGILQPQPSGVRVTPHALSPASVVFVAKRGARVVGTISLVVDSELGLPMDAVYGDRVRVFRAEGRRLAEVGALCVADGHRGAGVVYLLNRIMADTARQMLEVDDLLVAVHPAAEDLYRAALLFERFGPVRAYPGLEARALAVGLRLDLRTHRERTRARFGRRGCTCSNPFWLYYERVNPQVASETARARVLADELLRRRVTRHLAALTWRAPAIEKRSTPAVAHA